jgi:hypothetical protein
MDVAGHAVRLVDTAGIRETVCMGARLWAAVFVCFFNISVRMCRSQLGCYSMRLSSCSYRKCHRLSQWSNGRPDAGRCDRGRGDSSCHPALL